VTHRLHRVHLMMQTNGYVESFHGRLRDELLNAELFSDVREASCLLYTSPSPRD